MNANESLPEGWTLRSLADIAEINPPLGHGVASDDTPVTFVPMRAVGVEGSGFIATETRPYGQVKRGYTAFRSGDIITAKITPCMENGKTMLVPEVLGGICFGSTEFHVVRPDDGINGKWLELHLLRQDTRREAQLKMAGAVGQMRVPASFLKSLQVPVPPRCEQSRVAQAMEELSLDLATGVAALERCREKLRRYRASTLKSAVEGDLTADWRSAHPDAEPASTLLQRILAERRARWEQEQLRAYAEKGKTPPKNWKAKYKQPVEPEPTTSPSLPDNWCWASLDQLGQIDRGRSKHRPRNADFLYGGPYPFIQTGDVKRANRHLREHTQTYSKAGLAQSRLWPEDTLCITIAANIAETAILTYPACFPDSIIGVLFMPSLVSVEYVELFMQNVKIQVSNNAHATAQKNINNQVLRKLTIPLPPVAEQRTIVARAVAQISAADQTMANVDTKLGDSGKLRQSLLHAAFTGKLLPQDPNDEPASKLVERIAANRGKA